MSIVIPIKFKVRGHFHLTAINADTGEVRELADFDNLIVNQGLDFIGKGSPGTGAVVFYGCSVGTGTTPAAPGDILMQNFLAGTNTNVGASGVNVGSPTYATSTSTTYQFATGVAAGNLTEIGIVAPAAGQGVGTVPTAATLLFSHSLIMIGGSPGTITILANEILNVVYTVTMFPIVTTLTGTFTLNTNGTLTTVNYSILSAGVGASGRYALASNASSLNLGYAPSTDFAYTGTLGLVTGVPTGTNAIFGTGSTANFAAYTTGTFFQSITINIPVAGANLSPGIGAVTFVPPNGFSTQLQIAFSPIIPKTNIQTFSYVLNISWSN